MNGSDSLYIDWSEHWMLSFRSTQIKSTCIHKALLSADPVLVRAFSK